MPVIMPEDTYGAVWLDPAMHDKDVLFALLRPYPSGEMEHCLVTSKVNSFKYNDPKNIRPVARQ